MKNCTRILFALLIVWTGTVSKLQAQTITSVTVTESRCPASGTITVTASGGTTPYVYAITAGPQTRPNQSSNVLIALPAGTYTVRVTDNVGDTVVQSNIVISGNYTLMAPTSVQTSPYCVGGSDGKIAVTIPTSGGRAPYSFQLISPSPLTTGVIAPGSNTYTFTGLPAGAYTYRVTDSCGNFQTRNVTLNPPSYAALAVPGNSYNPYWDYTKRACDSVDISLSTSGGRGPYTTLIYLNGDSSAATTMTARYGTAGVSGAVFPGDFRVPYTTACNGTHRYRITDSCGTKYYGSFATHNISAANAPKPVSCSGRDVNVITRGFKAPITYSWAHSGGTTVQVNDPNFNGLPPGTSTLTVTDSCGSTCTLTVNITARTKSLTIGTPSFGADYDSTAAVNINGITDLNKPIIVTYISGPASYSSAKHNNFSSTITYPKSDTSSPAAPFYVLKNLPVGSYRVAVRDSCGFTDTLSFSINSTQVRLVNFESSVLPGCIGANKIKVKTRYNALTVSHNIGLRRISPLPVVSYTGYTITQLTDSVTFNTLGTGTYEVNYTTFNNGFPLLPTPTGNVMRLDTLVITPYSNPVISSVLPIPCPGTGTGGLLIASVTNGVYPYQYAITAGPSTRPNQTDSIFTGLATSAMPYTIRVTDACGNSNSNDFSLEPIGPPNVSASAPCASVGAGDDVTISADTINATSYAWSGPGSYSATGRVITIMDVTSSDTGLYTLTATTTGCAATSSGSFRLRDCGVMLPLSLLSFKAQELDAHTVQILWETAQERTESNFELQHSRDASHWETIAKQRSTHKDLVNRYSHLHEHLPAGMHFYRIQIQGDYGDLSYSEVLAINTGASETEELVVYPNPASEKISLYLNTSFVNGAQVQVFNELGEQVYGQQLEGYDNSFSFDVSHLEEGLYLLHLQTGRKVFNKHISIIR